jgi:hypothetical protein
VYPTLRRLNILISFHEIWYQYYDTAGDPRTVIYKSVEQNVTFVKVNIGAVKEHDGCHSEIVVSFRSDVNNSSTNGARHAKFDTEIMANVHAQTLYIYIYIYIYIYVTYIDICVSKQLQTWR